MSLNRFNNRKLGKYSIFAKHHNVVATCCFSNTRMFDSILSSNKFITFEETFEERKNEENFWFE